MVVRDPDRLVLQIALGLDYFGIQLLGDNAQYEFQKIAMQTNATVFSFFYGHRFGGSDLGVLNGLSALLD